MNLTGASNEYHNIYFCGEIRKIRETCRYPLLYGAVSRFWQIYLRMRSIKTEL